MISNNVSRAASLMSLAALFAFGTQSAQAVTLYSSGIQGLTGGPGTSTTIGTLSGQTGSASLLKGFGDDYTTNASTPTVTLTTLQFVGGVSKAGGAVFFEFYNSAGVLVNDFGSSFASAGAFIYTATPGTPIVIPSSGYLIFAPVPAGAIANIPGSTFSIGVATGTDVGFNDPTITAATNAAGVLTVGPFVTSGGVPLTPQTLSFELDGTANVPEPGAVALLMGFGVSGLALIRRRKTARK